MQDKSGSVYYGKCGGQYTSDVGKHSCMGVCMEQASYREKRRCGAACMLCRISDIYLYEIRKIMYKMKKVFIEEIQGKEYNSVLTV